VEEDCADAERYLLDLRERGEECRVDFGTGVAEGTLSRCREMLAWVIGCPLPGTAGLGVGNIL
jgi:hypothetical protein